MDDNDDTKEFDIQEQSPLSSKSNTEFSVSDSSLQMEDLPSPSQYTQTPTFPSSGSPIPSPSEALREKELSIGLFVRRKNTVEKRGNALDFFLKETRKIEDPLVAYTTSLLHSQGIRSGGIFYFKIDQMLATYCEGWPMPYHTATMADTQYFPNKANVHCGWVL